MWDWKKRRLRFDSCQGHMVINEWAMNKFLEKRRSQSKLKSMFLYRPLYEQFKVSFWKEKKKRWLFMAMVWNVKFDWLGNLFIGFSQRLKHRKTGSMMVTGDVCVKAYTPLTVFMFKLATSNNFVLLLDDKIASLWSVVIPRSRCTCKHKRAEKCYVRGE